MRTLLVLLAACGGASSTAPPVAVPPGTVVFRGTCDASGAVPINRTQMIVADDENNILRLYDAEKGGDPISVTDVSGPLGLPMKGKRRPKASEMDLEAGSRLGDRAYWLASHGRDSKGEARAERVKFFATGVGSGQLELVGHAYDRLLTDLLAHPPLAPYGLAAAAAISPKEPGGLNLEGMTATPDGKLLLAFRSPVPEGKALLVPLLNPGELVTSEATAAFGEPILLDLGGQGVRSLSWWRGQYLVIAGPAVSGGTSRLFAWSGKPDDAAVLVAVDLSDLNPEGFFSPEERDDILLLSDDGTLEIDGRPCKKLKDPARQTFRGRWAQPPHP
jgi:Protein of unknown function (DUF3616)